MDKLKAKWNALSDSMQVKVIAIAVIVVISVIALVIQ